MSDLLITNARLIDLETGESTPKTSVLVRNGIIESVDQSKVVAPGVETVDAKGAYLLPGFIDCHVHVTAATFNFAELSRWSPFYTSARAGDILSGMLSRGFTTVRDAGGADHGLARAQKEGIIRGPRLLFGGKALSQTGGHGDMRGPGEDLFQSCYCCPGLGRICDGVTEVRKACRDEIRRGANHIKLMLSGGASSPTDRIDSTQFSLDEIAAAVEEAEAANIYVFGHAYTARAANRALKLGVRSIEHGNLIDDSTRNLLLEKDAFLVPTMSTHEVAAEIGREIGLPESMIEKTWEVVEAGKVNHAKSHAAGVKMAFATDLLGQMHVYQLREFELRNLFQTPLEILRSATNVAADLVKMAGQIGVIVEGAHADFLLYDGDPTQDIDVVVKNEENLKLIVQAGRVVQNTL
ncbi:amidohydrolase family protein [Shimia sp.]|uniref:metal-dependent hydrolase family protein n=1 Tax=Shimia sp. TaxID=1954381 RepID=UPI003298A007